MSGRLNPGPIDNTPVDMLANWALQTGLWVGVLLGLVLILRRPFARLFGAQATYGLWAIPALRLIMPPIRVPESWWPFETSTPEPAPTPSPIYDAPAVFETAPSAAQSLANPPPSSALEPASALPLDYTPLLLALWLGVTVLWLGWQLVAQLRFLRSLPAQTSPAPQSLQSAIAAAASALGMRRTPRVLIHSGVLGPCVTGLWRGIVILPHDFEQRFAPEQQVLALIHEFAHLRRGDLPMSLIALSVRALNWPNPLMPLAARAFRVDQEAACDATVMAAIDSHRAYANTLLSAGRTPTPPHSLRFS